MGLEWVLNPVVRTDIAVPLLLSSVGGDAYPQRRDELVALLDIDMTWRMHMVSDGERRRVQLAMGLVRPWKVLLLDEITVDLDLLTRARLLGWLKRESETGCGRVGGKTNGGVNGESRNEDGNDKKATVIYATHVFGAGQGGWATHLVRMCEGKVKDWGSIEKFMPIEAAKGEQGTTGNSVDGIGERSNHKPKVEKEDNNDGTFDDDDIADGDGGLGRLVLKWLREDFDERGPRTAKRGGQGKTYQNLEGRGGYGLEKRVD